MGYKKIKRHLIFDIQIYLTRKARYVTRGHLDDSTFSITYTRVDSRDSICIVLLIAALNNLETLASDIKND